MNKKRLVLPAVLVVGLSFAGCSKLSQTSEPDFEETQRVGAGDAMEADDSRMEEEGYEETTVEENTMMEKDN